MSKSPVIKIDSGVIIVPVQVDDNPAIDVSFNPNDKSFAETLHGLYFEAKAKIDEINKRPDVEPEKDENGMPLNVESLIADYEELNQWFREKIDRLLGEGVSQSIFGDTIYSGERLDVYVQLLTGLFEVANPARKAKVQKHVRK